MGGRARSHALALLCTGLWLGPGLARGEEPELRVLLRWQAIPGAVGYDLQVATDPAFAQRELELRVELAGHRLAAPQAGRRYWRVRSVDAYGRPGPWSLPKTIEPVARSSPPAAEPSPLPAPEPKPTDVPPLQPAPLADAVPMGPEQAAATVEPPLRASAEGAPFTLPREPEAEGNRILDVLRAGRPGARVGWRANLLGGGAPTIGLEGAWPLPWLGERWSGAVRGAWWRERASVQAAPGLDAAVDATADVVPLAALLFRSFPAGWGRPYAGAGLGADLVLIRLPDEGALEASAALEAVAGAGRRFGPGEAFAELCASAGGVDGPLGRLRTGGISFWVGYRLER